MKIIGLTGGIASGKSTVLDLIKKNYNVNVFDCDKESHMLLENIDIKRKIEKEFGNYVFDNEKISRKKLGEIVFSNKNKLKKLNDIIHPVIKEKIKNLNKTTIVDIPLLFECGFSDLFNEIVLVYVNYDNQIKRLIKRNNISKKEAENKISLQIDLEEKRKYANYIIDNNTNNLLELEIEVKKVFDEILEV